MSEDGYKLIRDIFIGGVIITIMVLLHSIKEGQKNLPPERITGHYIAPSINEELLPSIVCNIIQDNSSWSIFDTGECETRVHDLIPKVTNR